MIPLSTLHPRRPASLSSSLAVLVLLATPGAAYAQDHGHASPVSDGAALYAQYCSVCHGDRGDGQSRARGSMNPPPRDFTTPQAAGELSRERMVDAVTRGVPGTAMAGWASQLDTDQIEAVVDHVRTTLMLASIDDTHDRGRAIYAQYCSVCHGDRGDGRSRASGSFSPRPRDFTSVESASELARERMIASITFGRANTAMAPWQTQLSRTDIEATVDFIRRTFMHAPPERAVADRSDHGHAHQVPTDDPVAFMASPLPSGLHVDVSWGKRFYDDNCAVCHGVDGDGQGPRAYFILPKPRDFGHTAAQAELNRPHLFEAIAKGSVGTEMAAWEKVLTDDQIASVAEHVFRTYIRPAYTQDQSPAAPDTSQRHGPADHHEESRDAPRADEAHRTHEDHMSETDHEHAGAAHTH